MFVIRAIIDLFALIGFYGVVVGLIMNFLPDTIIGMRLWGFIFNRTIDALKHYGVITKETETTKNEQKTE